MKSGYRVKPWIRKVSFFMALLMISETFVPSLMAAQNAPELKKIDLSKIFEKKKPEKSEAKPVKTEQEKKAEFRIRKNNFLLSRCISDLDKLVGQIQAGGDNIALAAGIRECAGRMEGHFTEKRQELVDTGAPQAIIARHDAFASETITKVNSLAAEIENGGLSMPSSVPSVPSVANNSSSLRDSVSSVVKSSSPIYLHRKADSCKFRPGEKHRELVTGGKQKADSKKSSAPPPVAEDLSASPEAPFTQEIIALANELGGNPVNIYEHVRNNFKYEPYYGCIKGASETLRESSGNDADIAALTIALLRTSGIPARYVKGNVRIPSQVAMDSTGAATPTLAAATFIRNGIPASSILEGGKITGVRVERIWVRAWINPHPYLGVADWDKGKKVWVDFDPAFKTSTFTRSRDIASEIGFDPETFLADIKSQSTINNPESFVTSLPEDFILGTMDSWGGEVEKFLDANSLTLQTVFRSAAINRENYKALPISFPYKIESVTSDFASFSSDFYHKLAFRLHDSTGAVPFTVVKPLNEIIGKRITLSSRPATADDEAVVDANMASPDFPAYLVRLIPQLKIDGTVVAEGASIGMGVPETLTIDFNSPDGEFETISHKVLAGGYYSIGINPQKVPASLIDGRQAMLENTWQALSSGQTVAPDDSLGETLHLAALNYYCQIDSLNSTAAGALEVNVTRRPSELISAYDLETEDILGVPVTAKAASMKLDVRRDLFVPVAINGETAPENQFMITTAMTRSALEHNTLEQMFRESAVSAVRIIQAANDAGTPIYTVKSSNIDSILPKLSDHPSNVLADIQNAVASGATVTVPETRTTYANWTGSAYIVMDPDTGASSYMLEKGINGGEMKTGFLTPGCLLKSGPPSKYLDMINPALTWLRILRASTDEVGKTYLPATAAINRWFRDSDTLDNAATVAACIAVSSPITQFFMKPAILNVVKGESLISPNNDGIKDAFTITAKVTSDAEWTFCVKNSADQIVHTQTGAPPDVNASFGSSVPDGLYTYELSAEVSGIHAKPVKGSFSVDKTIPFGEIRIPEADASVSGGVAISGTADDVNFESCSISIKPSGATEPVQIATSNEKILGQTIATFDSMSYPNGSAELILKVSDKAGNVSTVTRKITISNDRTPPAVNIAVSNAGSPVNPGATVTDGNLDISVTATDSNSVTSIKLYRDGILLKQNTNSNALSFSEPICTYPSGNHELTAKATDKSGNIGTASFAYLTASAISDFKVTPKVATVSSPTVKISATLSASTAWTVSFSGPSSIPNITGTGTAVSGQINGASYQDGEYTATLTAGSASASLPFTIDIVDNPPIASISSPSENQNITEGLFNLTGTANDPDPSDAVSYKVWIEDNDGIQTDVTPQPVNAQGRHEGKVANGSLGTLDLTMVRNGSYTLRLVVTGGTQSAYAETPFALSSKLKVGQFTFSQQDIIIPAGGQTLTVIRTYDSLRAAGSVSDLSQKSDFGPGWTYSIKDVEMKINETRDSYTDIDGQTFKMRTGGGRNVDVTLPDGQRVSFTYSLKRDQQNFCYHAVWNAPQGTYAMLRPTCSDRLMTIPGLEPYWEAAGMETPWENFDFPAFNLTMKDGSKFLLEREDLGGHELESGDEGNYIYVQAYGEATLRRITQPSGDRIEFSDSKIEQFNPQGAKTREVAFQRDGQGRIIAIHDPENLDANGNPVGPAYMTYEYDPVNGNLIKVNKLEDRATSKYLTTEFLYEEPARTHFITSIKDPRGITPLITEYDDSGRLTATVDAFGNRIELNHDIAARTETVFDRSGNPTVHRYDASGNVTSSTDALGNTVTRTYDSAGNELTVTDPLGNKTSFSYDSSGNRTSVTDPLGNTVNFTYDGNGNQLTSTDPLGNTTTNNYDGSGNLLSTTNALGQTTSNTYDANGNLKQTKDALGNVTSTFDYDGSGNMTSVADINSFVRNFAYDGNGNQTGTSYLWTDPSGQLPDRMVSTSTVYNDAGQVVSTTDPNGNTSTTKYNDIGKPYQTTDILGNTTTTVYDDRGNVVETQYPDGTSSQTVYDVEGRAFITADRHVAGEAANGTRTIYDIIGRVVRTERLSNVVITVNVNGNSVSSSLSSVPSVVSFASSTYDKAGRVLSSTDAAGAVTRYEYDAAGRTTAVIDALGNRTEYEYDNAGRQTLVRDALGREVTFVYDALGRRVRTNYADGTFTTATYNSIGQKIKETDQASLTTEFVYDESGKLKKVIKPSVANPEQNNELDQPEWTYSYDNYGRLSTITDPKGRQTVFTYDALGRQLTRTLPMGQSESQEYNSKGQLWKKVDFKGQVTEFFYDSFGRIQSQDFNGEETVQFTYDALGRQSQIIDSRGTTEFTYDNESRLIKVSSPEGDINYEYDSTTGRKTRTWTAKNDVSYTYDSLGRLKTVEVNKLNGEDLASPEITTYDYTAVGSRESVTLPNGISTQYAYDNLNRLTNVAHYNSVNTLLASYAYTLAPNGRRTGINEQVLEEGGSYSNTQIAYTYDKLNRLTEENSSSDVPELNYSNQYKYDLCGNRLLKTNTTGGTTDNISYVYNNNDQLLYETSSTKGQTNYQYDPNGSLTDKNGSEGHYAYTYNSRNQLKTAQIQRAEGNHFVNISANYAYDYSGIRVQADSIKTIDGIQTNEARKFLVDAFNHTGYSQVFEESVNGIQAKSYVIGDDVLGQSVSSGSQSNISYLLYDGHGSTRLLSDNSGSITDVFDYDAYGMMLGGNPNATNPAATSMLYTGEQFDSALNNYYLRARYYDPNNGRFTSLDTFSGNNEDPQSLHKYAYTHCDPVNGVDPSGKEGLILEFFITNAIRIYEAVQYLKSFYTVIKWTLLAIDLYQASHTAYKLATGQEISTFEWVSLFFFLGVTCVNYTFAGLALVVKLVTRARLLYELKMPAEILLNFNTLKQFIMQEARGLKYVEKLSEEGPQVTNIFTGKTEPAKALFSAGEKIGDETITVFKGGDNLDVLLHEYMHWKDYVNFAKVPWVWHLIDKKKKEYAAELLRFFIR